MLFNTITVSDGISMGTPGMRYSLVSREVIADSIETVVGAEGFDGFVAIGGCDKNMPGCAMAIARLNRPAVFVYGGTIRPGAQHRDIVSVFEAVGARAAGKISDEELRDVERTAIPGPGSCGGMYTANTMASAIEALGLSLPNSSAQEAVGDAKRGDCRRAGEAVVRLLEAGIRPADILTRKAFENAITMTIALAGSTNAVLHLLAIAHEARVKLRLDDFTRIGKRVPVLADVRPSGRYLMSELIAAGGIQPLMKTLLDAGLLHGDCLTVTGRTLAENLSEVGTYFAGQDIVRPLSDPIKKDSHLVVLYGNVAPEGAVAKITGKEGLKFQGRARVYDGEEAATRAILDGAVRAGDVVVIRYEGPKGAARDEGNAESDRRHHGAGPRQQRGAHHRWAFLRWYTRFRCWTYHPGSCGRWTAGPSAQRRHVDDRCGETCDPCGGDKRGVAPATRGVEAPQTVRDHGRAREIRAPREQRVGRCGNDWHRRGCGTWITSLSAVVSAQSSG